MVRFLWYIKDLVSLFMVQLTCGIIMGWVAITMEDMFWKIFGLIVSLYVAHTIRLMLEDMQQLYNKWKEVYPPDKS